MNKHLTKILLLSSVVLALVACNPIQNQATSNPTSVSPKAEIAETVLSTPTMEAQASPEIEPTVAETTSKAEAAEGSTPNEEPTQSPSETPASMDSPFTLVQTSAEENWRLSITIEQAEPIDQSYYALVGEHNREYDCVTLTDYGFPNRLYCYGRIPRVDDWIEFTVYETKNDAPVFSGRTFISLDEVP
jgi:hypothetical protein